MRDPTLPAALLSVGHDAWQNTSLLTQLPHTLTLTRPQAALAKEEDLGEIER